MPKHLEMTIKNIRGVLYGSFIKTSKGIRVIEYNCRFGDPEVIPLLESMKTGFFQVCMDVLTNSLNKPIEFDTRPYLTKYIVPEGYPTNSMKNYEFYTHELNQE